MKNFKFIFGGLLTMIVFFCFSSSGYAQGNEDVASNIASILEVQKYNRAIHIMAMLLVGFGFLMVFVRNYGRSALTATFLLVSTSIPFYFILSNYHILGGTDNEMTRLILSEFAAAGLLITAGAVLGRLKMYQYILLGLLFVPAFKFNEWVVIESGLGILGEGFVDMGGSIIIHAFGALFGVGVAISMTSKKELDTPIEADATSDRYSMLGSMVLWVFWPSFCAALVPASEIPTTIINVILALCGSTIITYLFSVMLRGKINIADIANAALAGGVAIGSTCNHASYGEAIMIGAVAGAISTIGFAVIQGKQQKLFKAVDTCGVTNLHGLPGILGGLAAIFVVSDIDITLQLSGVGITIVLSLLTGLIAGKILSFFGRRNIPYVDVEEFEDAED